MGRKVRLMNNAINLHFLPDQAVTSTQIEALFGELSAVLLKKKPGHCQGDQQVPGSIEASS